MNGARTFGSPGFDSHNIQMFVSHLVIRWQDGTKQDLGLQKNSSKRILALPSVRSSELTWSWK